MKLDTSFIFGQIHAFSQRCRDLCEIRDAEKVLGRRIDGKKFHFPPFAGVKGSEIEKSFLEISETFDRHLKKIKDLSYDCLDVKTQSWRHDFAQFSIAVEDLESVIVLCFTI